MKFVKLWRSDLPVDEDLAKCIRKTSTGSILVFSDSQGCPIHRVLKNEIHKHLMVCMKEVKDWTMRKTKNMKVQVVKRQHESPRILRLG